MKPALVLLLSLSGLLASCGTACRDLPVCLTDTPAERQPYVQGNPVVLTPGETRRVTVLVDRNGIPEHQALQLMPRKGEALPENILGRSRDGTVTASGSQQPFLGNQTQVTLTASWDTPVTGQVVPFFAGIRKVESRTSTQGSVFDVRIEAP